jgi:hypothetical protein
VKPSMKTYRRLISMVSLAVATWPSLASPRPSLPQESSLRHGDDDTARVDAQSHWPEDPTIRRRLLEAETSVTRATPRVGNDRFRPAFHFLPAGRFMNDPDGCVQFQGNYHVFFQQRPNSRLGTRPFLAYLLCRP